MPEIRPDLLEGHELVQTIDGGIEITRTFMVSGIPFVVSADARLLYVAALAAIPTVGAAHPILTNLILEERRIVPIEPTIAKVSLIYRQPLEIEEDASLAIGTRTIQKQTQVDRFGAPLTTIHTYNPGPNERVEELGGNVVFHVPQTQLVFTRRESGSPFQKAIDFVGKINGVAWQGEVARSWLCMGIDGVLRDRLDNYDVTYTFLRNATKGRDNDGQVVFLGWTANFVHIDPSTGQVPKRIRVGEGLQQGIKIYEETDFDLLAL